MQIKIKTLTGKVTDHNVEIDETVLSLKNSLQEKEVSSAVSLSYLVGFSGEQGIAVSLLVMFLASNSLSLSLSLSSRPSQGITVDQIKLIYNGKQLADDKTLESYNIEAGKVLHMVLTLRGGK